MRRQQQVSLEPEPPKYLLPKVTMSAAADTKLIGFYILGHITIPMKEKQKL